MKTFKHSGDLGDIIYSLPTIKELGGGVLYLDPEGGKDEPLVDWSVYDRTKLKKSSIDSIKAFLEQQEYIKEVKLWDPSVNVDYNLDKFRQHVKFNNLAFSHLDAFDLLGKKDRWNVEPWLKADKKNLPKGKSIILSRSCRYHGNYSFWECLQEEIVENAVFVSHPKEYEYFMYTFPRYEGRIPHLETENILDLAGYISGCDLFIGNQSFVHALAEGMKKPMINEVYPQYPSCIFQREGVRYV
tara:strand:+ start:117 stop:845 length:729 start_codon:yes stop_codon:yes gene_type:complete